MGFLTRHRNWHFMDLSFLEKCFDFHAVYCIEDLDKWGQSKVF
jgi:hypothetical protein